MLRIVCRKVMFFVALLVWASFFGSAEVLAIPSPLDHTHTSQTVQWKQAGSPALDWTNATANQWHHNHLTANDISNLPRWDINKAWDNRSLRSAFNDPADTRWAHGMILPGNEVRYGWTAAVPNSARDVVEAAFNEWGTEATTAFDAYKDPWDRLAIAFSRANSGAKEITVDWVANLGAYGEFVSATRTIRFESAPQIFLATSGGLKLIRLGDAGPSGTSINVSTPWSFDGTPDPTTTDFDYSIDGGSNWLEAPPGGFGDLAWNFGSIAPADDLDIFEMDFATIARHETGHAIALGHTGDGTAPIMRDDIALEAHFGSTMAVDGDSALAVAIDYTYAVPEPATLGLLSIGVGAATWWRRRHA